MNGRWWGWDGECTFDLLDDGVDVGRHRGERLK